MLVFFGASYFAEPDPKDPPNTFSAEGPLGDDAKVISSNEDPSESGDAPYDVEREIERLRSGNPKERDEAAYHLGELGDKRAVEPLIAALKDEDIDVRCEAAEALGFIGDKRAVEHLLPLLKHENPGLRWETAEALGNIGDKRALEPLIALLRDEDSGVRLEAAEALGKMGDVRAVETADRCPQGSEDKKFRAGGACKIGDKRAVEALIAMLKDENEDFRGDIAFALRRITGKDFGDNQARWLGWWEENKE